MGEDEFRRLIERVYNLEQAVRDIQSSLERLAGKTVPEETKPDIAKQISPIKEISESPKPQEPPRPAVTAKPAAITRESRRKPFEMPAHMRTGEYWLNKIGMGLVLFAVIFLFKYSVDKGWLVPKVRIIFGLALGILLLILGWRNYSRRRHFSLVLIGGSVATLYITGFAAFQLFSLVSYPIAFGYMVIVTILTFLISLKQDEATLSLLGVLGGLGTPFFLYPSNNVPGLALYTCLVLAGASAIYFYRGWNSLLWLSVICGGIISLIGMFDLLEPMSAPSLFDQWSLQAGIISGSLMLWIIPVIREVFSSRTTRWRPPTIGFGDKSIFKAAKKINAVHIHILTVLIPSAALGVSLGTWPDLSNVSRGFIILGCSAFCGVVAFILKGIGEFKKLALTNTIVALSFLSMGFWFFFSHETLLIILAVEAVVLHMAAVSLESKGVRNFAHALFTVVGVWLLTRLYIMPNLQQSTLVSGTALFNIPAMADLGVILLGYVMSARLGSYAEKRIYLLISYSALAAFFCRELNGNLLFFALTVEAVTLFFIARWNEDRLVRMAAHVFFAGLGILLYYRLAAPDTGGIAVFNIHGMLNLLFIAVVFSLSRKTKYKAELYAYGYYSHIALLSWFMSELVHLDNGQGYVTISWGVYAAILLVVGLRLNSSHLRLTSLATLFLVTGKLFLVDLATLEILWRILLFMGFGGLFLFLSYYFQALWRPRAKEIAEEDTETHGESV